MANVDNPHGFRAVNRFGGTFTGSVIRAVIPSSDATATFIGDAVKLHGDSVEGSPTVIQVAAGDPVYGVVQSFEADPATSLEDQYRKASTQRFCQVAIADDNAYFAVQADDVGTTLASTHVGQNADITGGSGSTATGISAMELDSSTVATTATLDLQIVGFLNQEDNEIGVANQEVIVKFNDPQSKAGRTGV